MRLFTLAVAVLTLAVLATLAAFYFSTLAGVALTGFSALAYCFMASSRFRAFMTTGLLFVTLLNFAAVSFVCTTLLE